MCPDSVSRDTRVLGGPPETLRDPTSLFHLPPLCHRPGATLRTLRPYDDPSVHRPHLERRVFSHSWTPKLTQTNSLTEFRLPTD